MRLNISSSPYRLNGLGGISFCQSQFLGYSAVINITNGFHYHLTLLWHFQSVHMEAICFALIQAFRLFLFLGEACFSSSFFSLFTMSTYGMEMEKWLLISIADLSVKAFTTLQKVMKKLMVIYF